MQKLVRASAIIQGFNAVDEPILHKDSALLIENGLVQQIGLAEHMMRAHPAASMLGGLGTVVMPGLINAHHHVGLTPLQLGSPDYPLELWFASRLALRDVDLRLDTLFSAFEMVASGVTTVQHLHSRAPGSPDQVLAAAQTVMAAYREIGMRASYSMALRDQNRLVYEADQEFVARLPETLRPAMAEHFRRFTLPLSEQVEVFQTLRHRHVDDPLVQVQIAPANLHWLSDAALETVAELAARTGAPMHMHLMETPYQKAYARRRTDGSAFRFIERMGLAGPRLTLGHGVWMTEDDIGRCAQTGTRICHNCSSNFRLRSGVAPLNRFRAAGISVAIGIDEAGLNDDRDMLQEMRLVLRTHGEPGINAPHPTPSSVLRMATEHGAKTTPFAGRIGQLFPGMAADLVLLDWTAVTYPYQSPDLPVVDVLVQRARSNAIRTVMIGGEVVYHDGRFTFVDRDAALAEIAEQLSRPLSAAEEERRSLAREIMPHVHRFYDGYLAGLADEKPHYRTSGRT
jgi:cytosine/adenosine deaminase-related metal-dependent hydrolase